MRVRVSVCVCKHSQHCSKSLPLKQTAHSPVKQVERTNFQILQMKRVFLAYSIEFIAREHINFKCEVSKQNKAYKKEGKII